MIALGDQGSVSFSTSPLFCKRMCVFGWKLLQQRLQCILFQFFFKCRTTDLNLECKVKRSALSTLTFILTQRIIGSTDSSLPTFPPSSSPAKSSRPSDIEPPCALHSCRKFKDRRGPLYLFFSLRRSFWWNPTFRISDISHRMVLTSLFHFNGHNWTLKDFNFEGFRYLLD